MKKLCLGICSLALLMSSAPVRADDLTDLYFQQVTERYFEYPQNARTFGMAGSSVMTTSDSSSTVGNPAGLGFMSGGELSGSYGYNRISGDEYPTDRPVEQRTNSGSGMLALPLAPVMDDLPYFGNLGIAWNEASGRWDNDSFDTLTRREQVTVSYAYAFSRSLTAGYGLGWTRDKIQSKEVFDYPMGDGFRHTLGAMWRPQSNWSFGSTIFVGYGEHRALYGPGIREESDTFEFGNDFGAQYQFTRTIVSASVGYRHLSSDGGVVTSIPENFVGGDENGNIFDIRIGAEHEVTDWFLVRAGYRYAGLANYNYNRVELNELNGSAYYNAWSAGAGFILPVSSDYIESVNLDYGVEYRTVGRDDWQHLVTVSVPFTLCKKSHGDRANS